MSGSVIKAPRTAVYSDLDTFLVINFGLSQRIFEIGFMLIDPSSTVDMVSQHIRFLIQMMSDGKAPVNFCKMLPYAGTPIEAQLKREGRLRGTISQPDHAFQDPRMDLYAHFVHLTFQKRNFKYSSLVERLCTCLFDMVLTRFTQEAPWAGDYQKALLGIARQVNRIDLDTLKTSLAFIAERDFFAILDGWGYLIELMDWEMEQETRLEAKLTKVISRFNPELIPEVAGIRDAAV